MIRRSFLILSVLAPGVVLAQEGPTREEILAALRRAAEFYRTRCGRHGGYVYRYAADLSLAEGEGKADADTIWVQPPGTPTVGEAFLRAHAATRDSYYLGAARAAADALVRGQLQSGGWDYSVRFAPAERQAHAYRVDGGRTGKRRNRSTLDDDTTQAALRLLMQVDQALAFKDASIHQAAVLGLAWLLERQFANGAWYVNSDRFNDPALHPVHEARFPENWSRTWTKDFRGCYVLNDNSHATTMETLWLAGEIYAEPKYSAAARRGADFLLLAQLPEPQPAWAQQYDADMYPVWSRKFEPPAVTAGESQGVLRVLLETYRRTGDRKYLEPIPRSLAYLKACLMPDGKLARFYELRTNKPLYFTRDYRLTYDARDVPRHYAFIINSSLDSIEREYRRLDAEPDGRGRQAGPRHSPSGAQAANVLSALDERGAWVTRGGTLDAHDLKPASGIIESEVFARNVRVLCDHLAAAGR